MEHYLISKNDLDIVAILAKILEKEFKFSFLEAEALVTDEVKTRLDRFKPQTKLVVETEYVDRVYRDSYYAYYASKCVTTCLGLKFYVKAFSSSSQDTETISCAETTVWALMEYYGNKYAEYSTKEKLSYLSAKKLVLTD